MSQPYQPWRSWSAWARKIVSMLARPARQEPSDTPVNDEAMPKEETPSTQQTALDLELTRCATFDEVSRLVSLLCDAPEAATLVEIVREVAAGTRALDAAAGPPDMREALGRAMLHRLRGDKLLWLVPELGLQEAWDKRDALLTARQQVALAVHAESDANADMLARILLIDVKAVPLDRWPEDVEVETQAWLGACEKSDVVSKIHAVFSGLERDASTVPAVLGIRDAVQRLAPRLSKDRRADFAAALSDKKSDAPVERSTAKRVRRQTQTITVPAMTPLPESLRESLLPFVQTYVTSEPGGGETLQLDELQRALDELAEDRTVALPSPLLAGQPREGRALRGQTVRRLYAAYVNKDPDATAVLAGRSEAWARELTTTIRDRGGFAPYVLGWLWGGSHVHDSVEIGRFYLPVKRAHAADVWCALELELGPIWQRNLCEPLFKMGPTLAHFQRSDTCVIYSHHTNIFEVWEVLAPWVATHEHWLRPTRPLFTALVHAPSGRALRMGFGQSAPMGQSFGEYRAKLVAQAVRQMRRRTERGVKLDLESMLWLVATHLRRGRVDLAMPALLEGESDATGPSHQSGRQLFAQLLPYLR